MSAFDPRTGRVLLTILIVAAALAFVYAARRMLITFLFAIFFAYLIDPLVSYVQRWVKGSRGKAIAIVYAAVFAGIALFLLALGSRLWHEASHLGRQLPALYQKLASGQIAWTFGREHGWSEETTLKVQHWLAGHQQQIMAWLGRFGTRVAEVAKSSWYLVLIPILGVFFLKDGRRFADGAIEMLSRRRQREFLDAVLRDVNDMLAHFIRAQLILAVLSGIAYTAGLLALGVQFAVVLGAVGGALEFIPVVGPLVAFVAIVAIALLTAYKHIIILVLFLGVWRGVQDYVNSPRIMGKRTELHPLAVLFGVLVGAEIAGVVGVYLSIPIMATLRIVWRHWHAYMNRSSPSVVTPTPSGGGAPIVMPPGQTA